MQRLKNLVQVARNIYFINFSGEYFMKLLKVYLLLCAVCTTIILGCASRDTATNPVVSGKGKFPAFISSDTTDQVYTDYFESFSWTNVVGMIGFSKVTADGYTDQNGSPILYQTTYYNSYATIYNHDLTDLVSAGDIVVNNVQLKEYATGTYNVWGDKRDDLVLNFGSGTNKFLIDSTADYPAWISDSVDFGPPIAITNLTRNQDVSRNSSLTITWSGSGNGIVLPKLETLESSYSGDTTRTTIGIIPGYVSNSGTYTIPAEGMTDLKLGKTNIIMAKVEPKFITMPNGKKLCLLAETHYVITVNIID